MESNQDPSMKHIPLPLAMIAALPIAVSQLSGQGAAASPKAPYTDPSLPVEQRVGDLLQSFGIFGRQTLA